MGANPIRSGYYWRHLLHAEEPQKTRRLHSVIVGSYAHSQKPPSGTVTFVDASRILLASAVTSASFVSASFARAMAIRDGRAIYPVCPMPFDSGGKDRCSTTAERVKHPESNPAESFKNVERECQWKHGVV